MTVGQLASLRELRANLTFVVTPTTCKALMDAGYDVTVERSTQRIFDGEDNILSYLVW